MTVAAPGVAFELERFAWREGAFEVAGRWRSDQPRSLGRVRLCVELAGRRRRLAPDSAAPAAADPSGQAWSVRFAWPEEPAGLTRAELEVGRRLAVELPLPGMSRRRFARTPATGDVLPDHARANVEALLEQLHTERAALVDELAALATAREGLAEERAEAIALREGLAQQREVLEARPLAHRGEPVRLPKPASGELFAGHAPWVLRAFALGLVALLLLALVLILAAMM